MTGSRLSVHMMTASFVPGDAIGNYMLTSANHWRHWGAHVAFYADNIAPPYAGIAKPSVMYPAAGNALLWYHYSIYTDNIILARSSQDLKIMDFHGIAPPQMFAKHNSHLSTLCQRGIDLLPELTDSFDYYVVHSNFTRDVLLANGYDPERIYLLPLCVDSDRYESGADPSVSALLTQIEYFLFVGRIVPQKDIEAMLDIFSHIHRQRPQSVLILVGNRQITPGYQFQLKRKIEQFGLVNHVLFTGQVNNSAVLAALFQNAKLLFITSKWETFCVPLVEAMYFGTPSVTHKIPPLPEIIDNSGLIIDKSHPHSAAESVLNLLADEKGYESLSRAAKTRANYFTEASLGKELLAMLSRIAQVAP